MGRARPAAVTLGTSGESDRRERGTSELAGHSTINARPHRWGQAIAVALIGALGCNGNGNGAIDDAGVDSGPVSLQFETQVSDLATGAALFDATVAELGADNQTSSAPNGRAVLELSGDAVVRHELAGYLANDMEVSAEALAAHVAARQPQLSELATEIDLDDLYTGLGLVRDVADTTVLIYVRRASDFAAAAGVTISGGDTTAVRRAGGDIELGDTVIDDPLVIIANAPGGSLSITASGTCIGATELTLAPGQLVSTFLVCE